MKKLITLFAAAGLVFAASAPASAVDVKLDGSFEWQHTQGGTFAKGGLNGNAIGSMNPAYYTKGGVKGDRTQQMIRLGVTAAVSESLSGYFQMEAKWDWGTNTYWGTLAEANPSAAYQGAYTSVRMRQGYIDWLIPSTPVKVRMGRQLGGLPGFANGKNPVFQSKDPVDGIYLTAPVADFLSLTAFWARIDRSHGIYDKDGKYVQINSNTYDTARNNNIDLFALVANFKFNGFKFSPFVAGAAIGKYKNIQAWTNNNNSVKNTYNPATDSIVTRNTNTGKGGAFWAGTNFNLSMFDPFTFDLGVAYGRRTFDSNGVASDGYNYIAGHYFDNGNWWQWKPGGYATSQHGWFIDAKFAYKTPYVTPTLLFWWGSGDKKHVDYAYQGVMPSIGGRFKGSYGFFNGSNQMDNESFNNHAGQGSWGLRLAAENISFIKDLTHEIALVYAQGTHDKSNIWQGNAAWAISPARYMTSKDKIFEIDFGTTYKIYKNLTVSLELAYVIEDFETYKEKTWYLGGVPAGTTNNGRQNSYDNAWKASLYLGYKF